MPSAHALVEIASPNRYLVQLCQHFGHRVPASHADGAGRIDFPAGSCVLVARGELLTLRLTAEQPAELARLQGVITTHLHRFAFRDPPAVSWQAEPPATP